MVLTQSVETRPRQEGRKYRTSQNRAWKSKATGGRGYGSSFQEGIQVTKTCQKASKEEEIKISERRKKEFLWRGYTLDQLLEMPLMPPEDDFEAISIASLMPSRAKRSIVRMYEG